MLGNGVVHEVEKIMVAIKLGLRLLSVAFAAIALMLALHQPSAAAQYPELATATIHVDAHHADCAADHPMHSISCCSMSVGLAALICTAATEGYSRPVHGVVDRFDPTTLNIPSKLYRPPRAI